MTETAIIPDGSRVYVRVPKVAEGPAIVLESNPTRVGCAYLVQMQYGAYEIWASADEVELL